MLPKVQYLFSRKEKENGREYRRELQSWRGVSLPIIKQVNLEHCSSELQMSQMSKDSVYETLDKVNGKVQLQRVKKGTSSCSTNHPERALPVPLIIQREHFLSQKMSCQQKSFADYYTFHFQNMFMCVLILTTDLVASINSHLSGSICPELSLSQEADL